MADYVHAFALILSQQIVTIPYGHQFSSPASIPLLHMRQVQCLSCDSTPTPSQTAFGVDKLYFRELCEKKKIKLMKFAYLFRFYSRPFMSEIIKSDGERWIKIVIKL